MGKVCTQLIIAICSPALQKDYGIQLHTPVLLREQCIADPMEDQLDAVLCAIQVAWAYQQQHHNYGIPVGFEQEGWIIDPLTLRAYSYS